MKEKKILKMASMFIFAILLVFGVMSIPAKAATNIVKLKEGKTYTSYDMTGNGKKNKFKYVKPEGSFLASLYLDGKKKASVDMARGGVIYRCQASKNNIFLMVTMGQFGANDCQAYVYKDGKFQSVYKSFQRFGFDYNEPASISSTTLYIKTTVGKHDRLFDPASKAPSCKVKYKISNKKINLASHYAAISGTYTATKSFKTSDVSTRNNTKGVSVKKGAKVTLKQVYFPTGGEAKIKIAVGSKTGWVGTWGDANKNTIAALK